MKWTTYTENIFSVAQDFSAESDHGLFSLLLVFTAGLSQDFICSVDDTFC
jgi:hypothetical protein